MYAAVVHAFDAPPRYTTFADPVAAEGERLVKVSAAGLHPIVKALAKGTHYGSSGELPFIAGIDGVGKLEDGTRVFFGIARSPFGTFAERALAASWMCLPLPEAIDDVTAAGIANPAMSSWAALTARAKFVAGESVLILGATGVAGQLAIQVAKRLGARRVVAAGRDPKALETLKTLGADAVISLDQDQASLVSAFRNELRKQALILCSTISGVSPQRVFYRQSRKKVCARPERGFDLFRLAKAQERRSRCLQLRCAVRGLSFLAAASAARLSIKFARLLQSFSRWQRKSPSSSIQEPLPCGTLKRSGTSPKKVRGWYFSPS